MAHGQGHGNALHIATHLIRARPLKQSLKTVIKDHVSLRYFHPIRVGPISDFFQGCPETDIDNWKNTIVPAARSSYIALCQINGSAKTVCEIQNNFFNKLIFKSESLGS